MGTMIVPDNLSVRGTVVATSISLTSASITSAMIAAGANINADKLEHRHVITHGQDNAAAAAQERVVHVVKGTTGLIESVSVGSIVAATGDSTVTIDVEKNGTSVLSSAVTLNSSSAALTEIAATVDGAQDDLAAGDILSIVITVSAGTGTLPTGVFVNITLDEIGT